MNVLIFCRRLSPFEETQFPFERLQIELTEQALVRQVERAAATIQALRVKGVKVAIDDFGMGYSSLSYLRQFPADVLKIDQSFIQEIQTESDAKAGVSLADAIIAMAKGLGLSVIAEGWSDRPNSPTYAIKAVTKPKGICLASPAMKKRCSRCLREEATETFWMQQRRDGESGS